MAGVYSVIREIHFSYGHRLPGYPGKCRYLHGHNGKVEIEFRSDKLDDRGMVLDFDEVRRRVQGWIESELDHRCLLSRDDTLAPLLKAQGEPVVELDFPPTAENIARMIFEYARGAGLPVASVRLWESPASSVVYSG